MTAVTRRHVARRNGGCEFTNALSLLDRGFGDENQLLAGLAGTAVESAFPAGVGGDILTTVVECSMATIGDVLPLTDCDIARPMSAGTRIEEHSGGKEGRDDSENEQGSGHGM